MQHKYYTYIVTNDKHNVLYTGMTNDLKRRIYEHKNGTNRDRFATKYRTNMLMYYEIFDTADQAIRREKQIKAGPKQKKIDLINSINPQWRDLYEDVVTF